jgi:hypothetical protein
MPPSYGRKILPNRQRWAISLADISLLIACMMLSEANHVGLKSPQPQTVASFAPAALFMADEARIHAQGLLAIDRLASHLPKDARVQIHVPITRTQAANTAQKRLNAWELAAARTAAIARKIEDIAPARATLQLTAPDAATQSTNITLKITS